MSALIDSVARMTHSRDRDALEATVVEVLADVIRPLSVRLYNLVPVVDRVRVHCRVQSDAAGSVSLNLLPRRSGVLPTLDEFPHVCARFQGAASVPVRIEGLGGNRCWVPVSNGVNPFGWIEIDHIAPLTVEHQRLIAGLLRIYGNHLAILDYGEHDSLTGLMNRKTFDGCFQKAVKQTRHDNAPCELAGEPVHPQAPGYWLAVLDIDHFKRVNDRFGHLYGDEVLVLMARLMRASFRLADRLYRFGGEEFAIILDSTPPLHAPEVFERFRRSVADHPFPQIGQVTISLGFTRVQTADDPATAFDRADAALYHAKQNGRNRVCSFETLQSQGRMKTRAVNDEAELFF